MIIKTQGGLTYINSKHIVEFRVNRLHDEEKKCAIIAKLDYEEKDQENTLAVYADEEQFKEEFSRFITAMITDEDKMFFFAKEKEPEPKKEQKPKKELEPEQEQEQPAEEEVDIDELIELMKKVYVHMLLKRVKDMAEWIEAEKEKEKNGSGKEV